MPGSAAPKLAHSPDLSTAWQDFYAARYSACIEACGQLVSAGTDQAQALTLRARALTRLERPSEAISGLVGEIAGIADASARLEAESVLAIAYATANDFASAEAALSGHIDAEDSVSPQASAELTYAQSLIAWMKGDLAKAAAILSRTESESTLVRGRRIMLESWIAHRHEKYDDHARFMLEGAEIVKNADVVDVGLLAGAVRAICTMAREVYIPNLVRQAKELYDSIDWAGEISVEHFNAARTLGWAMALQGPDRYFESLRLLHQASSIAPTPAWKVWSLLDRAAMKRYAGELASSSADLYEALELTKTVSWGETANDERTGLLYAAEILATVDAASAASLLSQFNQVRESLSTRMAIRGDRLLEATTAYSTGVVQQALSEPRKARHFFESAYFTYDEIKHKWRAARTALRLYEVTQDPSWHEAARRQIRDYPNSWIAADVREASTGIGDDGWNRLTPRQREVFNALCEGLTAKRIGDRLKCSPNTVRNHIHWVYQAFRVQSQPELITEARKRKLIS
jgi:DNA-binding CsgD family transcriptional regulator